MSKNLGANFWSPLFLAGASVAFAVFWGSTRGWNTTAMIAVLLTVVFIAAAYLAARRSIGAKPTGGDGGSAKALGEHSYATGGDGGHGVTGYGGDGGSAVAKGVGSRAQGGRGGDA